MFDSYLKRRLVILDDIVSALCVVTRPENYQTYEDYWEYIIYHSTMRFRDHAFGEISGMSTTQMMDIIRYVRFIIDTFFEDILKKKYNESKKTYR